MLALGDWHVLGLCNVSFCVTQLMLYTGEKLSSPIFCCLSVCQASVSPDQISTFSNIYRHTCPLLTMYHLISSSTNLYWPSTSQYRHILTQYHQVPLIIYHLMSHAQYTWSSFDCCSVVPPKLHTSRILICILGDVCWPFQALILMYANQPFSAEKSGLLSCLDTPPLFSCWIFPITLCRQFWNIAQNVFFKTLSKMFQRNLLCCLLQKVVRGEGGAGFSQELW